MKRLRSKGFTIIELLVVVSIISLLMGILLPAIGKARDQARLTLSQANLRNLGTAHVTYSAEYNDRQLTFINDNIARYGDGYQTAFAAYQYENGIDHPGLRLGRDTTGKLWAYRMSWPGNWTLPQPIIFDGPDYAVGFGSFRLSNCQQFSQYMSGRFYDPVFYAPKDKVVLEALEKCIDSPDEFCQTDPQFQNCYWTSYCLSPAAMLNPEVMKPVGWVDPWLMPRSFCSPAMSQVRYGDLKTHMLEHHWLQNNKSDCNPYMEGGAYDDCEPYYFNHGYESVPMTLFYDGHIEGLGVKEAMKADGRMRSQTGDDLHGLWKRDTPFGSEEEPGMNGYFGDIAYDDVTSTSFHILTTDGIFGRDKLGS